MTEIQAIQMLQTQPLEFLRKNSITPYAAPGLAGTSTFYMVDANQQIQRPGQFLGKLRTHQGQRFQVRANNVMGGTPFNAVHIPVQPSNIAINAFPLPLYEAGIMITTQLTGCCIVMVPGGGTWSVAHLQPTGENGVQLRQRLANNGIKVYGATDYAGGRAALIGVRINSNWSFYTQIQDGNFNVQSVKELSS
jgi:hypothetical protein